MVTMRTGRAIDGMEVNQGLVEFLAGRVLSHMMHVVMKSAVFFVESTGRSIVTPVDVLYGLVHAAHTCTAEGCTEMPGDDDDDDDDDDDGDSGEEESGEESSEESSEESGEDSVSGDDDEQDCDCEKEEDFSSALVHDLSPEQRALAARMKKNVYEWEWFTPKDEVQSTLKKAIDLFMKHAQHVPKA